MHFSNQKVVELPLEDILPNRFQPRITFGTAAIHELSESIKEHGVIQPIVVRRINDKYEIIAGERRYKASTLAGLETIPAIITDLNDKDSAEIALIENVQREDLTPIEEAVSYKKILDMGYLTQEELSSKLGKTQSTISNKLRLLNLDEEVQEALLEKQISERHARSLLKLDEKNQRLMLERIIKERLTVRKTDDEINKLLENKNQTLAPKTEEQEIEVLDLSDLIGKGENKMNNNDINNFNIPNAPIINDNSLNEVQVEQMPNVGHQQVTPSFVDVDRIANNASDINVQKEAVPMNNLLEPTPMPAPAASPAPTPAVDSSIFGFTPQSPSEAASQPSIVPTQVQPKERTSFFTTPVVEEEHPVVEQPQIMPNQNTESMFNINKEPKNPNFVTNVEAKETNMDFGIPTPAPVPTVNVGPMPISTPTVEPTSTPQSFFGNISPIEPSQPTPAPVMEQPVVQQVPTPAPAPQPEIIAPNYNVPSQNELDSFLNNLDSTTPLSPAPMTSTPSAVSQQPTTTAIPVAPTAVNSKMSEIAAIIKEAQQKIEALGIKVEMDEFDFDDMYQAIFKIDK